MSPSAKAERPMKGSEKRQLALLGIPTLALALATTVVTTYVPVAARSLVGSTVVIGLVIGIEGLLAVPDEVAGRGQSTQAVFRGAGTGLALLGGGVLLSVGHAVPFLAAAAVFLVAVGAFAVALLRRGVPDRPRNAEDGIRDAGRHVRDIVR